MVLRPSIRHTHLNMPVEVQSLLEQLAANLALGERRPDLLVRFGYGPWHPNLLRRAIEAVQM